MVKAYFSNSDITTGITLAAFKTKDY